MNDDFYFTPPSNLDRIKKSDGNYDVTDFFERLNNGSRQDQYLGIQFKKKRRQFLAISVIFIFLILLGRSFYLQIMKGDEYRRLAEGNRLRNYVLTASRGVFYDRQGRLLIRNVPTFALAIIPNEWPREDQAQQLLSEKISNIIGVNNNEFSNLVKNKLAPLSNETPNNTPRVVYEFISQDQAMSIKARERELTGVVVLVNSWREFLPAAADPHALTPLLGYLGKIKESQWSGLKKQGYSLNDVIGQTGLESYVV